MTSFDLSTNYIDDPEALLKRTKAKLKKVSALESKDNHIRRSLTPEFEAMANKTLHDFSAPTTANIRTGPTVNVGDNRFKLKPALINMVQANQFCGKAHEDESAPKPKGQTARQEQMNQVLRHGERSKTKWHHP